MCATFCWVENPIGLLATNKTSLAFLVVTQRTFLTKVVLAPVKKKEKEKKAEQLKVKIQRKSKKNITMAIYT